RIAVDLDGGLLFELSPNTELSQVSVTPGARLLLIPELYARLASLNYVLEPVNSLALVGLGYYLSGERMAVFLELNYVAWSNKETETVVIPRVGVEAAF